LKTPLEIGYKYGQMLFSLQGKLQKGKIDFIQCARYALLINKAYANEMNRATEALHINQFIKGYAAGAKSLEEKLKNFKP